jgi:serine/threonine-protein kinase RIO1
MESMEGIAGCDCAIKIFKTTLNEFSNRAAYIDGDPRFGKLRFNKVRRKGRRMGVQAEERDIRTHNSCLATSMC